MDEQFELLLAFPASGAPFFDDYRRVMLKRFPYMVVYRTDGRHVDVLAIISVWRDPEWIEATVASRGG